MVLTSAIGVINSAPLSRVRILTNVPLCSCSACTTDFGILTASELPHAAILMTFPLLNDSQNDYCVKLADCIMYRENIDGGIACTGVYATVKVIFACRPLLNLGE
jgi:hypothetical protein